MELKYQELKKSFNWIIDLISQYNPEADRQDVEKYLLSMALRIWASNGMYADEYREAICAVQDHVYGTRQVMAAMACCGEENRDLRIPGFIRDIELANVKKHIINEIGDYLAAAALINGDFTTAEAARWSQMMEKLAEGCLGEAARELEFHFVPQQHITELNRTGYYKSHQSEEQKQEHSEAAGNSPEPVISLDSFVSDLEDKVNEIIDSADPTEYHSEGIAENANVSTPNDKTLNELLEELDGLVGLDKVKADVRSLMNFIKVANMRRQRGLKIPTISYHLVFTGNPGTGKTTIARLVAQIYYKMGLLTRGQLVETDRSALVAGYLGQTAIKTQKVIQEALGGVLFIDEAYALAGDEEDSYGKEAIETILKAMEDHRDDLVVIVAGYDGLMHKFINSNPGLRSRFNKYFNFPDYTGGELTRIFQRFCETNGYQISVDELNMLMEHFGKVYDSREEHFGNARAVRNVFETAICCQANRIADKAELSETDLVFLTQEDIQLALEEEFGC